MLFAVNYTNQSHGDEALDNTDGSGGIAIVDVPSAEVLLEAVAPWSAFLTFSVKPLVPIEAATPIIEKGVAWRDSVK